MKSHITVIINSDVQSIEAQLNAALEKYRLNEKHSKVIPTHHWNSWLYYHQEDKGYQEGKGDQELTAAYPSESERLLRNACYVKNLPGNYETSGVISPDGRWWDLQDSGWRINDEPSIANDKAYWKWTMILKSLFNQHEDCIAVQVVVHS